MTATSDSGTPNEQLLRAHAVGLYDALDTPLQALQNLAQELRARPDQDARQRKTADDIQSAAVHLAQARQALHKAAQEWPAER